MIGVDTNVLVRLFVRDDARQVALARRLIWERTADAPAFISSLVVAELIWALSSVYGYGRREIVSVLEAILDSANVVLEHEDAVRMLVDEYASLKVDLSDVLIAQCAKTAGCETIMTLDKIAAKHISGMELLG